jgi:hypothetical protein
LRSGELSASIREQAAVLVGLVANALLGTIRLGGTVPAYGGGVGMGAVQDGITGVLNNILRADMDLVTRRSAEMGSDVWDGNNATIKAMDGRGRVLGVQEGQQIFRQLYGTAELSKLGVCCPPTFFLALITGLLRASIIVL